MHPLRALLAAVVFLLAGCASEAVTRSTRHFPSGRGFVRSEIVIEGARRPLWVFIPKDYDPSEPRPAVVFLHGLFEAGHDGKAALSAGLAPVIARAPEEWPFIVLFPQSSGTWRGAQRERLVMHSLDWAQRNYAIDPRRVILAGLSYGGLGAWQIGARHPQRFAAIVSVSGPADPESAAGLIDVPVWAFHARGDLIVPATHSARMCDQISSRGGRARYTSFDIVAHDCWDRAVAETDVIAWMLEQRRPIEVTAAAD